MPQLGRGSLFGPVLFYELLRTGRRGRYVAVRFIYGFLLLVVLFSVYTSWLPLKMNGIGEFFAAGALPSRDLTRFSASFFAVFMLIQFAAVLLLTPAYTAGAVADEKERGTLEALMASDLASREIVLGKAAARFANLELFTLTGLPILSALQFLGGVDPNLLLASFLITGVTILSLTSLGIFCSVRARKPAHAIVRTYVLALLYLILSGAAWVLLHPLLKLASFPSTEEWPSPITLEDVVPWINIGNPVALAIRLRLDMLRGGDLSTLLPPALLKYACFHVAVAVGCLSWAVACLRARAQQTQPKRADAADREPVVLWWALLTGARPRVFRPCVLWKAVFVDEVQRGGWFSDLANGVAVAVLLLPVVHLFCFFGRVFPNGPSDQLGVVMNVWLRLAAAVMGSFLLLVVAFRAAGSVSGERDRQTLDGLLVTPLSNRSILFGKWLGAIFSLPQTWLTFALIAVIGVATGGFHPLAIVWFLAAWLVLAALAAGIGLWFSVAGGHTHLTTLGTALGLVAVNLITLAAARGLPEEWIKSLPAPLLTPPGILAVVSFSQGEYPGGVPGRLILDRPIIPVFLSGFGFGAIVLWVMAAIRFRVMTQRELKLPIPATPPFESITTVQGDRHEQARQSGTAVVSERR